MQITTSRLLLRPITLNDAADVFEYSAGPNVGVNAGWKPHDNIEETIEIIKLIFLDKPAIFGLVLKETGKLIGSAGLMDDPKRVNPGVKMLGYAMGEQYWGKGLMTEAAGAIINYAFRELKCDYISAYCYPHNPASKRVLEKCGFKYEGCLKACEVLFNGNIMDNECFLLKNNL